MYLVLIGHLNLDQSHFKFSRAICGQRLSHWAAQAKKAQSAHSTLREWDKPQGSVIHNPHATNQTAPMKQAFINHPAVVVLFLFFEGGGWEGRRIWEHYRAKAFAVHILLLHTRGNSVMSTAAVRRQARTRRCANINCHTPPAAMLGALRVRDRRWAVSVPLGATGCLLSSPS